MTSLGINYNGNYTTQGFWGLVKPKLGLQSIAKWNYNTINREIVIAKGNYISLEKKYIEKLISSSVPEKAWLVNNIPRTREILLGDNSSLDDELLPKMNKDLYLKRLKSAQKHDNKILQKRTKRLNRMSEDKQKILEAMLETLERD